MGAELKLTFESVDALQREHQANLAHGRAFLAGHTELPLFAEVDVIFVHPANGRELIVHGQIVMVLTAGALVGSAFQFVDQEGAVAAFAHGSASFAPGPANENANASNCARSDHLDAAADAEGLLDSDPPLDACDSQESVETNGTARDVNLARERQLRLRNLPPQERLKVAYGSVLDDRVLLERIYGPAVWDALLHNPKITVPEVARIARKGTLSKPLIDWICDNEAWIRQSIVRRALLANPRMSSDNALRVLRTLPQRELKLVPHQTAYPPAVRQAAQRLIKI